MAFDKNGYYMDPMFDKVKLVCGNHSLHKNEQVEIERFQDPVHMTAFYRCRNYVSYAASSRDHASCRNRLGSLQMIKIIERLQKAQEGPLGIETVDITGLSFTLKPEWIQCRVLSHDLDTGNIVLEVFNPKF